MINYDTALTLLKNFNNKVDEFGPGFKNEIKEVVFLSIDAISKQKPKKVIYVMKTIPKCPSCSTNLIDNYREFCCSCGQHLDWSENNNEIY